MCDALCDSSHPRWCDLVTVRGGGRSEMLTQCHVLNSSPLHLGHFCIHMNDLFFFVGKQEHFQKRWENESNVCIPPKCSFSFLVHFFLFFSRRNENILNRGRNRTNFRPFVFLVRDGVSISDARASLSVRLSALLGCCSVRMESIRIDLSCRETRTVRPSAKKPFLSLPPVLTLHL